jgi:hypothetical protein
VRFKLNLVLLVLAAFATSQPLRAIDLIQYFFAALAGLPPPQDDSAPLEKEKPVAENLVRHEIGDFGSCSFFAKRGVRWLQEFPDHSRLEIRCEPEPGSILPGFHVWYSNPHGNRMEIGRCIFDAGLNHGWYFTRPGQPGLARVEWVNLDGGKNDGGPRRIEAGHFTNPAEPYADIVRWHFDAESGRLEVSSDKYNYQPGKKAIPVHPSESLDAYIGDRVAEFSVKYVKSFPN